MAGVSLILAGRCGGAGVQLAPEAGDSSVSGAEQAGPYSLHRRSI